MTDIKHSFDDPATADWYLGQSVQCLLDDDLEEIALLCLGCKLTVKLLSRQVATVKHIRFTLHGDYRTIRAFTKTRFELIGSDIADTFTYLEKLEAVLSWMMPEFYQINQVTTEVKPVELPTYWRNELFEVIRSRGASNQGLTAQRNSDTNGRDTQKYANLLFGSFSEIRIAQAFDRAKVMYFANSTARVNRGSERTNREPDFLICQDGRWGILEVDGEPFHPPSRTVQDHEKDRLFAHYGVRVIQHYDAERCRLEPDQIVSEFLALLAKNG